MKQTVTVQFTPDEVCLLQNAISHYLKAPKFLGQEVDEDGKFVDRELDAEYDTLDAIEHTLR